MTDKPSHQPQTDPVDIKAEP